MAYDKDGNEVELTPKQITRYMDAEAAACPFCDSTNISGEAFEPEGSMFSYRNVKCYECGASWTERLQVESVT